MWAFFTPTVGRLPMASRSLLAESNMGSLTPVVVGWYLQHTGKRATCVVVGPPGLPGNQQIERRS